MSIHDYYGKSGSYLTDHADYLTGTILKRDLDFVIRALKLTKSDKCLDLQCAQGRLTIGLAKLGYAVDGLDKSSHMLALARKAAKASGVSPIFIKGDIQDLKTPITYTKIAIFFPDWGGVDLDPVLQGVFKSLERNGLFLYDQDNLFRLWNYLMKNPGGEYAFDPSAMTLMRRGERRSTRYFVMPELKSKFEKFGFRIIQTYGGWRSEDGGYASDSERLRIVARKIGG